MTIPKVEVLPIEEGATTDPLNVNKHTQRGGGLLENSLRKRGAFRSIASAGKGVKVPVVMAGNFTLEKAVSAGFTEVVNVHVTGNQIVNVVRDDLEPNSPEAIALGLEDNEIGKASYNPDLDILAAVMADPAIQALKAEDKILAGIVEGMGIKDVSGVEKGKRPNARQLPLDIIYTLQMADCTCCLAVQAGWLYGINSAHYRLCPYTHQLSNRHEVQFIDNDYFKYDHAKHLDTVRMIRPKYCTVRDIMTEEQCNAAGIAFYSFEQIMIWAEELAQYCPNVIIIPKYDCIKDIPKKFMLGYSIPTSHGGTPLPVDLFRGRRVHLLGGSWAAQLDYLSELGEDVVSLDNNHLALMADKFGQFDLGDGKMQQVNEITPKIEIPVNNPRYVAMALSFGAIASKVNELYSGNGQPAEV